MFRLGCHWGAGLYLVQPSVVIMRGSSGGEHLVAAVFRVRFWGIDIRGYPFQAEWFPP